MNHRQDWKERMNKNDDQGKRILNEPLLEMKMNEEKRKNRREELEEQVRQRGFRWKEQRDHELIKEHLSEAPG